MKRWKRWLILLTVTFSVLALTSIILHAASQKSAAAVQRQHPTTPDSRSLALPFDPPGQDQALPLAALEPELAKKLALTGTDERLNIIVEMREQPFLGGFTPSSETDASARRQTIGAMQSLATQTQAGIRAFLAASWLAGDVKRVTPFWIFNGLAVHGVRTDVVQELATRPDVAVIRLDQWRRWISAEPSGPRSALYWRDSVSKTSPVEGRDPATLRADSIEQAEWGVSQIRADEVWNALGIDGSGVVVGNIDTGVDWQHPALHSNYRGYDAKGFHQHKGNWYDATGEGALYPVDGNGHGSHTMGTAVGQGGIGVAPGARWIAVRGFGSDGFAYDSWLHASFEWLLAPEGDPDLAPQVINNSWGSIFSTAQTFQNDINALRAAGVLMVFSVGNSGPEPKTVGSPASLPGAFAVGASDEDDDVVSFSSRGPSPWGEIRPHLMAPGVNINSSIPGGVTIKKQGTSMAAPHVAGTVALMLSARPGLNITQTSQVLINTAVPLSITIPNNDSGYGRVDAYAAVALAANAGLISGTVHGAGVPLSDATVRATPAISGLGGSTQSDEQGRYRLFLGAGHYDVAASAFGYAAAKVQGLPVVTGSVTLQGFDLIPLPVGRVQGTVTTDGGDPVEAVVSVLGTPVTTTSAGGAYGLDLPSGAYTLEARAVGYRVVTASVTITAGQNSSRNLFLPQSLRILLVDSGPWYYRSQVSYYRQALDDLSFAYDERAIKHIPQETPTASDLQAYDLVIWAAPEDSPQMVGAGFVLAEYLSSGGDLLISGQDVAYWDGGGTWIPAYYYRDQLHSLYRSDDAPSRQVVCTAGSALGGISLTIRGGDGADNQRWPDEISVFHPDHAALACSYQDGQGAVIQAGFCNAHRALNLGFGFEAIDSQTDRAAVMARALDWFDSPRRSSGVELVRETDSTLVAAAGAAVTHTFRLRNLAEVGPGNLFDLEIDGAAWPTTLLDSIELAPCGTSQVQMRVDVPGNLSWNAHDRVTLTARSAITPAVSETLVVTSKVPAPILLVDDDRWYDQEQAYESALQTTQLPYDRWQVTQFFGAGSPPPEVLAWYPIVLWFTGYDWFDPLSTSELDRLTTYLDQGGRFFLSSQFVMYDIETSALARDYLGVISHSHIFSQTAIQGVPGHLLGDGLGVIDLTYPYDNWSDSIAPAPGTQVALRGLHGQPAAVTRESACAVSPQTCRWRTAFFSFPFEALPDETRATVMSRLVGWLSWLGGSTFEPERTVAQIGDTVHYALTLRNDGVETVWGVSVSNTLPAGANLVGNPSGGAVYDAGLRRITWQGDLAPTAVAAITYQLNLADQGINDPLRNVADIRLGAQSISFQRWADVHIGAPDLSTSQLFMRAVDASKPLATALSSTELSVTIVLHNTGLRGASNVHVDHPLLWPLRLVTGTLSASGSGTPVEAPENNRVEWNGEVPTTGPVTLTYRALAPQLLFEPLWVYNAARIEAGPGRAWERGGWLNVKPHRSYLPLFFKNG